MQESYQPAVKNLPVYTYTVNAEKGIGVGYQKQQRSTSGALAGLVVGGMVGALVGSAVDGAADASADSRTHKEAAKLATRLARGLDPADMERQLQAALSSKLRDVPWMSAQAQVKHMSGDQLLDVARFAEPTVMTVELDAVMGPDLAHVHLIAKVRILSRSLQYAGVYPNETEAWAKAREEHERDVRRAKREGKPPPKEVPIELREVLYRNTFEFISRETPVADTTVKQLAAIRARYISADGSLPAERDKRAKMNYELSAAEEAELKRLLEQRTQFWLANDGAELKRAVNEGVQELAQLLARDLKDTQVPAISDTAPDSVEAVANSTRRIVRFNSGLLAGQYVSEPVSLQPPPRWDGTAHGDAAATK